MSKPNYASKVYAGVRIVGPGGMACACCSPWGLAPHKTKKPIRRKLRRVTRLAVRQEVDEALLDSYDDYCEDDYEHYYEVNWENYAIAG